MFSFINPLTIGIVIAIVLILLIALSGYVKAPPDMAYIISGFKKKPRILIGQAGIKIPFLERLDKVSLKLIALDIKTRDSVPTADYINIYVDTAVNVKIGSDEESVRKAMQNFLNQDREGVGNVVREVLEGNIREIICTMNLKDLVADRKAFVGKVSDNVVPDLENMGLKLVSFNVQNFRDDHDAIDSLGIDNLEQIKKTAAIARAHAEKEVNIEKAKAEEAANAANVEAGTKIAEQNNELAVKQAELKIIEDKKRAEADAAYRIQEEEQRKSIETATALANIEKEEREIELKKKAAAVKEQELDAVVKKQADADKYATEQRAEAELIKEKREADAVKLRAEANKHAQLQEAEGIKAKGEAEAAAIRAKGEAEAAAMDKKAEAYAKYNDAAIVEMLISVLPEVAAKVAEPLSQIDKITIIGGDSNNGINSVAGNVPIAMAKVFETMKEVTGVDMTEIAKSATYDAKVTKNVNLTGIPEHTIVQDGNCDDADSNPIMDLVDRQTMQGTASVKDVKIKAEEDFSAGPNYLK